MNTLPTLKGMLLSIFFFGIFYANIPTAEADSPVTNVSISPASSNEFNVVSFKVKPAASGLNCVLWAAGMRIDDLSVPVSTILTPSLLSPTTSYSGFHPLYQPAINPYLYTPVSIRLDEYYTAGIHTLTLVFVGSFCTDNLGPSIGYFFTNPISFTVTPPLPPPVNGKCASPKIHYSCAVGDPDSDSVIPIPPDGGIYSWRCLGSNGGSDALCNEFVPPLFPRDGACSSAHYNCLRGVPIDPDSLNNTYTWKCTGENGGKTAFCEENRLAVNGICSPVHFDCVSGNRAAPFFQDTNKYTWKCQGQLGGLTADCLENKFPVLPTLDLKIDGQEFLDDVAKGSPHTLTWTSANATFCTASSTDSSWTGMKSTNNMIGESVTVNNDVTYGLECTNNRGMRQDFVPVTLQPTLSLCTEGGLAPFAVAGETKSRNLYLNMSERLQAFYDTDPMDCAGTEVRDTWAQDSANPAVSISGNGTTPQVITAGPTANLTEDVTLTQGNDSITLHYIIQPFPCLPNCSNAPNICSGTTFNASNCGTNNCTGTKSCDYNFREASP